MTDCQYKAGDLVFSEQWDCTHHQRTRVGLCAVLDTYPALNRSGWMVRIESLATGRRLTLDSDWIYIADNQ